MKTLKNALILFFAVILPLLLLNCSERYKEPAPFFDGLYLEYKYSEGDSSDSLTTIYNISKFDNNHFKIIETLKLSPTLTDLVDDYFIDDYGMVFKSSIKDYKGRFSPIWIPTHVLEIGDTFNKGYYVTRKDRWEKWNVLVVKSSSALVEKELYYEIKTGFFVGSFAKTARGGGSQVLVNTNANIPVVQ